MSRHGLRISDGRLYLGGEPFLVKGLRCSNALVSDAATDELFAHLNRFAHYGVNTVSICFMGSRFGDVVGYELDGGLAATYADRIDRSSPEASSQFIERDRNQGWTAMRTDRR